MTKPGIIPIAGVALALATGCSGQSPPPNAVAPEAGDGLTAYEPRPGRDRPVIAVVAPAGGAELTDFAVPYGILSSADVADVVAVSIDSGPVELFPALIMEAEATTSAFDLDYPEGADYVIVPATHDPADAALTGWLLEQAARGATIVGVCDGVLVLAEAGLLDGRRATGHWFSLGKLQRRHPDTRWVRDRRYVADGNVITTTGVSASVPVSLALVEAIAGEERAREVARSYGVDGWGASHDSDAYGLNARHVLGYLGDLVAFWRNETVRVEVAAGVDEVTLALLADAWSRTGRSRVVSVARAEEPIRTRGGLLLYPDRAADGDRPDRMLEPVASVPAGAALDRALAGIEEAYGSRRADFVALQLEHPRTATVPGDR
jgi:putative intracellular protease/amidase